MHKELQNRIPVSGFDTVPLPYSKEASSKKDYIGLGISYIEHSSSGVFFSQSFVTFSLEHKTEFVAKIKSLSDIKRENQILSFALGQLYENQKNKEELLSLLEENMTDEEYERAFEEYDERIKLKVKRLRKQPSHETVEGAKILLKALGVELGSDDIAEMLNLDVMEVERALQEYKLNKE